MKASRIYEAIFGRIVVAAIFAGVSFIAGSVGIEVFFSVISSVINFLNF